MLGLERQLKELSGTYLNCWIALTNKLSLTEWINSLHIIISYSDNLNVQYLLENWDHDNVLFNECCTSSGTHRCPCLQCCSSCRKSPQVTFACVFLMDHYACARSFGSWRKQEDRLLRLALLELYFLVQKKRKEWTAVFINDRTFLCTIQCSHTCV